MAQSQRPDDVHQDELCPQQRFALMDANKKVDLENLLCPDECRILVNILQNHPLRFNIAASSSELWFYLGQTNLLLASSYCHNNHDHFVPVPMFFEMVPFYLNDLGFTLELRSTSNFKTSDLLLKHDRTPYDIVLQDTLQVILAEHKSREELEAKQNMEKVKEHLMAEEIEKLVKGLENVEENVEVPSSPLRNNDNQTNPGTRLNMNDIYSISQN
ncbi:hypothetical protein Tco_1236766 [Tanacetum coccineum]